jgi:hypothetical protein
MGFFEWLLGRRHRGEPQRPPRPFEPGRPRKGDPPHSPGNYSFPDSESRKPYYGHTHDLVKRKGQHLRSGKLADPNDFSYQLPRKGASLDELKEAERRRIERHKKDAANKRGGGAGRPPKA